ncbi:MAG TPA: hypothetical protein VIF15_03615 [Polyangiaceae bacterium]
MRALAPKTVRALLSLLAATVLVTVAACRSRPAAGGSCRVPDQLVCSAGDRALVCEAAGTWQEVPCKGARGCAHRDTADECDDTLAADGDACPHNPPLDYACTADRVRALVCKDGRFALWRQCRGPDGCQVVDGRNVHCDTTLGDPGDPCAQQGTYACAVDGKAMLLCDGSTLAPASSCRGPQGCHIQRETRKVDCDDAVAQEGDPCDQPKRIACAVDHKAELVCQEGKYAKKRDCRRSDCKLEGNELFCD